MISILAAAEHWNGLDRDEGSVENRCTELLERQHEGVPSVSEGSVENRKQLKNPIEDFVTAAGGYLELRYYRRSMECLRQLWDFKEGLDALDDYFHFVQFSVITGIVVGMVYGILRLLKYLSVHHPLVQMVLFAHKIGDKFVCPKSMVLKSIIDLDSFGLFQGLLGDLPSLTPVLPKRIITDMTEFSSMESTGSNNEPSLLILSAEETSSIQRPEDSGGYHSATIDANGNCASNNTSLLIAGNHYSVPDSDEVKCGIIKALEEKPPATCTVYHATQEPTILLSHFAGHNDTLVPTGLVAPMPVLDSGNIVADASMNISVLSRACNGRSSSEGTCSMLAGGNHHSDPDSDRVERSIVNAAAEETYLARDDNVVVVLESEAAETVTGNLSVFASSTIPQTGGSGAHQSATTDAKGNHTTSNISVLSWARNGGSHHSSMESTGRNNELSVVILSYEETSSIPRTGDSGVYRSATTDASGNRASNNISVPGEAGNGQSSSEGTCSMLSGGNHPSDPDSDGVEGGIVNAPAKENTKATWILSTRAEHHATGNRNLLSDFTEHYGMFVPTGRGAPMAPMQVLGRGNVDTDAVVLPDVSYVPRLMKNLVSVRQLDELGYSSGFVRGKCFVRTRDRRIVGQGHLVEADGHYVLDYLNVPLGRSA
ncbi:hypothetical protein ACP70R_021471 [Stipagrostis hirtigluma subsp. patula]